MLASHSSIAKALNGAYSIGHETILLCGPVGFPFGPDSRIVLGGITLSPPYSGTVISSPAGSFYLLTISSPELAGRTRLTKLAVHTGNSTHPLPSYDIQSSVAPLVHAVQELAVSERHSILALLATEVLPLIQKDEQIEPFCALMSGMCCQPATASLDVGFAAWLAPHALYIAGKVNGHWAEEAPQLQLYAQGQLHTISATFFQTGVDEFSLVAIFPEPVAPEGYEEYRGLLLSNAHPIVLNGAIHTKAFGMEFTDHLLTKPHFQVDLIRETISKTLLDKTRAKLRKESGALLNKLQYFTPLPAQGFDRPDLPFSLNIEQVMPVASDGLLISGWMRDPYDMLESFEAVSALGFTLPMHDNLHHYPRHDVAEGYAATPYGSFEENHGFMAWVAFPEELQKQLKLFEAKAHTFRFKLGLQGGVELDLYPQISGRDQWSARDFLMKSLPSHHVSDTMLKKCLGPAASSFQRMCMEAVEVKEIHRIGKPVKNPLVSLSIPLYKRLDFLKVQLARFATDPAMRENEIIYVLDSPEQEQEVRDFLEQHSMLYELPLTLVIMKRNSGYAAATNTGANLGKGKYVLLLNSDVFPSTPNWTHKMAEFFAANKKIGTLSPRLVYEDGSIQHAGIHFAKATYPDWLNLHDYKGYPRDYPAVAESRRVPAVTGACFMMTRELWNEVDGLSTDYVIGDFEDSDLCLKCADKGYESWYFAGVELYHLERQSVPLNESYSDSLAWRYNAGQHTQRWDKLITKLMDELPPQGALAA